MSAFLADQRVRRVFFAFAASAGWLSLALQLIRNIGDAHNSGQTAFHAFAHFAIFFTTTTNLANAVVLSLGLPGGKYAPKPSLVAAVANFMVIVFVVFALLLDNKHRTGIAWFANSGVHYLMPFLALMNFIVFTPHGTLNWRQPFAWLIYPAGYFGYMLLRGIFADDYPYWFLDPARVGWPHLFAAAAGLLVVCWLMGLIFVWADGLLARFFKPVDASTHPA